MKTVFKYWMPVFFIICSSMLHAQNNLAKQVNLNAKGERLESVLQQISRQVGFYFSYDSKIIKKDSLVNIVVTQKPVKEVLEKLFAGKIDYKENGNYIILRKRMIAAPPPATVVNTYIIKGFISDYNTGIGVAEATVYDRTVLASTLSGQDGSFTLKVKTKSKRPVLNVSKVNYYDTSIAVLLPASDHILVQMHSISLPVIDTGSITILSPTDSIPVIISDTSFAFAKTLAPPADSTGIVEKTRFGKFLIGTKQKIQSLNLSRFYTTRAYQMSFIPGLSTHGSLSSQVENYVSLNAIGGYTGGTKAFEAAGVFNINRRDAEYFQAAGVLNIVGGNFKGLQAAGLHNHVLGNVTGFQTAGISNYVNGSSKSFQAAGIYNHVSDTMHGIQVAGIANFTGSNAIGVQVAGIGNITKGTTKGVQIGGIFNYTKILNGVQIGLINFADSSNGFSIGLINFVKKGMHQISLSTNEITNTNISLKTGNKKLYSILHAGYNFSTDKKVFSYGYGIGTMARINNSINLQPELLTRYLYTGNWSNSNILSSLSLNVQLNAFKGFSLFAAPVFNIYASNQTSGIAGYRFPVKPAGSSTKKVSSWIGFSAGVNLF